MEGRCLCKAVTVTINDDNLFGEQRRGHLCHCTNCKKVAGSLFGANLAIEESKVHITGKDAMRCYDDSETTSGKVVHRWFCGTCGVPIQSVADTMPGKVILKLGIFTDKKIPTPEWESFVSRRQPFELKLPGATQFKTVSGGEKMDD